MVRERIPVLRSLPGGSVPASTPGQHKARPGSEGRVTGAGLHGDAAHPPQQQTKRPGEARRALEALLGVPFTEGDTVDVLRNGDEASPAWLEKIGRARRSVDLLTNLWGTGPITDKLAGARADRARAGARVRVMLDSLGSKGFDESQVERMRSVGAQVEFFRPVPTWRITAVNARSHRRALTIDLPRTAVCADCGRSAIRCLAPHLPLIRRLWVRVPRGPQYLCWSGP